MCYQIIFIIIINTLHWMQNYPVKFIVVSIVCRYFQQINDYRPIWVIPMPSHHPGGSHVLCHLNCSFLLLVPYYYNIGHMLDSYTRKCTFYFIINA